MNKPINIQSFVCEVSKCPDIQHLKAENDGLKSQLDFEIQKRETVEAENERLKQALEDVREYVNSQVDGFGNYVYGITKQQVKDITDKINEVLK